MMVSTLATSSQGPGADGLGDAWLHHRTQNTVDSEPLSKLPATVLYGEALAQGPRDSRSMTRTVNMLHLFWERFSPFSRQKTIFSNVLLEVIATNMITYQV